MYNLLPLLHIKQSQNECTNFSDWRKQGKYDFETPIRLQYLLQGLGLAIVRALLVTGAPDTVVLLGSRDLKRGEAAVQVVDRPTQGSPHEKKMFSFGHCPKRGGGRPLPKFFDPVFPPCCPLYFDINIMLCDTFWSFLTPKSSKVPKF